MALHGAGANSAEAPPISSTASTDVTAASTVAQNASADKSVADSGLQSITVTATRRAEAAQDVPLSITAISGNSLEKANIDDVAKLAQTMAGVNFTDKGPFSGVTGANLIIRGLNSEATGWLPAAASPVVPPVATYVDDTPLFVNMRLLDLNRVEVLRGPQGTLYGSGSLGGTIRYVQNAPDPSGFDARAEVGVGSTEHTSEPNEDVSGMLNIPVTDTFAIRINAGFSYQAGFIDQPNLYQVDATGTPVSAQPGDLFSPPVIYGRRDVNDYQYQSARMSMLWKPSDTFHAQFSYYYQKGIAGGFPYVAQSSAAYNMPIYAGNLPVGTFSNPAVATQLYDLPPPAGINRYSNADNFVDKTHDRVNLAALDLTFDFGFATLTSSSSWGQHINDSLVDETAEYINFSFYQSLYGQNPRSFVTGVETVHDTAWTQELRLVSSPGGFVDWLVGLFYRNEPSEILENDWYKGYTDFYNACSAIYGTSSGDGVTPSYCGVGVVWTPGVPQTVVGLPLYKDDVYISAFQTKYTDLAIFGELTFNLTSAWSVTGGTRVFKQTVSQTQAISLLFDGPQYAANDTLGDEWRRALWKVNTAYHLNDNNLIYATWSQGFRRGGVNALPPAETNGYVTPAALYHLSPDTADNYELGAKGALAGRLRYSAAAFYIDWHNIQEGLDLTPLVLPGALNIGNGHSFGAELELDAALTSQLTGHVSYTYNQTKLTSLNPLVAIPNTSQPPPPVGGPLPGTPLNSVAVGLEYNIPFAGGSWTLAANAHYQSSVLPALSATVQTVPGFTLADARISYERAHWLATLYCNNLANELGITAYQDYTLFGNRAQAVISTPRTIGLTLAYSFKER